MTRGSLFKTRPSSRYSISAVWEEAENRLHAQKALMEYLLLGRV